MRLVVGMVALLFAVGASAASAEEKTSSDRITVAELKKLVDADKVLVVDVRSVDAYKTGHIAGSVSAPLSEIEKHLATLKSAKKPIVTYCTWHAEATSARAALKLKEAGVAGARALLGGLGAWQADGNPVVQGDNPR